MSVVKFMLRGIFVGLSVSGIWIALGVAHAQENKCDISYTILEGDTLSQIAREAYGNTRTGVEFLKTFNRSRLRNENFIKAGDEIFIPCIRAIGDDDLESASSAQLPEVQLRPDVEVAFLTGTGFPPFSDEEYPNGGMITAMVGDIMAQTTELSHNITFVNHWSTHLATLLLERQAFDAAFPWYKPDCAKPDLLDSNARMRCRFFYFSKPLYRVGVNYYVASGSDAQLSSHQDLIGKRVCRPDGYFTFDLAEHGLLPVRDEQSPKIKLLQPGSPEKCFELLAAGETDVVTINALLAETMIKRLDLQGKIQEVQSLATGVTLHIIVPKTRPEASDLVRRLNAAIDALEKSGALDELKSRFLRHHFIVAG